MIATPDAEEEPMRTICERVDVGRGILELSFLAGEAEFGSSSRWWIRRTGRAAGL